MEAINLTKRENPLADVINLLRDICYFVQMHSPTVRCSLKIVLGKLTSLPILPKPMLFMCLVGVLATEFDQTFMLVTLQLDNISLLGKIIVVLNVRSINNLFGTK